LKRMVQCGIAFKLLLAAHPKSLGFPMRLFK
jgi:hypothetical protein